MKKLEFSNGSPVLEIYSGFDKKTKTKKSTYRVTSSKAYRESDYSDTIGDASGIASVIQDDEDIF